MSLDIVLGGLGVVGVLAYALLGGADFGGGVWDALASGPRKAEQRKAIARAMGPVWEANHVWLIFVIVVMFTAFPPAYAALSEALFIPFHLVLLGIILRGAAFVFRAHSPESERGQRILEQRQEAASGDTAAPATPAALRWGAIFGVASVITPLLLGMCLGAVSSGSIHVLGGEVVTEGGPPWLSPLSIGKGLLALAICAQLAAVYLANETSGELCEDFRRRALLAATAVVLLSAAMLPVVKTEAPHLLAGLLAPRTLPVVVAGALCAVASGLFLLRRQMGLARMASVGQAACVVGGWALAQYPYIIYPDVRVMDAAAPEATLRFVLYTLPIGLAVLIPSLIWLFRVFKGESLGFAEGMGEGKGEGKGNGKTATSTATQAHDEEAV